MYAAEVYFHEISIFFNNQKIRNNFNLNQKSTSFTTIEDLNKF